MKQNSILHMNHLEYLVFSFIGTFNYSNLSENSDWHTTYPYLLPAFIFGTIFFRQI